MIPKRSREAAFQPFGHFNVSIHICDTFTGSILCNPCNRTFNQTSSDNSSANAFLFLSKVLPARVGAHTKRSISARYSF